MYLFRNYVYICSRLKLNISPMHQINHGQVSLLLRIKTTKPGRIPGDVGGCHCQPGVERQSSDGLKTPAVHLFRKVELLFSEIKTTNKHTLYLSIFNRKKPNFRAFWKLCSHFFPFNGLLCIFLEGGHLGAKRGRGYLGARMLFELNLLFNMTFTRRSSLVNNKHHNITFSIDLTDDVDLVDCDRQLPKKELILFSWNTREADINRPDGVVFWRMKFSLKCLP